MTEKHMSKSGGSNPGQLKAQKEDEGDEENAKDRILNICVGGSRHEHAKGTHIIPDILLSFYQKWLGKIW